MRPYRHIGDYRWGLAAAIAGTAIVTGFMAPFQAKIGLLNEGLSLLLLTLIIAAFWGWRVGLFAAVLTNLSLNFFFVQPLHTFSVQHGQNVFALIGGVIGEAGGAIVGATLGYQGCQALQGVLNAGSAITSEYQIITSGCGADRQVGATAANAANFFLEIGGLPGLVAESTAYAGTTVAIRCD